MLERKGAYLVHIEQVVALAYVVRDDVVELAGEVDPHTVRQVAAVREIKAEDGVSGVDGGVHGRGVRSRTRMRLHIGVRRVEQRLEPVDRDVLDDVDELAAAVVALARVTLGVLVGEYAALRLQRRDRSEVLRRDHLQRALLAIQLGVDSGRDFGVELAERLIVGGAMAHVLPRAGFEGCRDPKMRVSCRSMGRFTAGQHNP